MTQPTTATQGYGAGTYGVGVYSPPDTVTPASTADTDTITAPSASFRFAATVTPNSLTDTDTIGAPNGGAMYLVTVAISASIADTDTIGAPAAAKPITATSTLDTDTVGIPSLFLPTGLYGSGDYGAGVYGVGAAPSPTVIYPDPVTEAEAIGQPGSTAPAPAADRPYSQGLYGTDVYGSGSEVPPAAPDPQPEVNTTYGTGTYGYDLYFGELAPPPPPPSPAEPVPDISAPLFLPVSYAQPVLHILGIGPWSPVINWRGAANYGVATGSRAARPALPLPAPVNKGFTLRLNDTSEAQFELALARGDGIVIDEMDTDLWWRRRDPRTQTLEMIGRFNTSHVDMSCTDDGLSVRAQLVDYRSVLGERLVLKYLDPKHAESQWHTGTPITDIIAWALPRNTGLDLSQVTGDRPYGLGVTTQGFDVPPGTSIADVLDNLAAISSVDFEWWVETPLSVTDAPKLMFARGTRGADKGVTLFDHGSGPSPIASWTRNTAADNYANTLLFNGRDGGVVDQIPAQVYQYGQRDATDSNSSIGGHLPDLLKKGAKRKLTKLADRTPTYTIGLRQGFWRGRAHIDIGDTVRVVIRLGKDLLDEKYRVAEIAVDVDDNDLEAVTLTVGRLPASADPRSKRAPLIRLLRKLKAYVPPPGSTEIPTLADDE